MQNLSLTNPVLRGDAVALPGVFVVMGQAEIKGGIVNGLFHNQLYSFKETAHICNTFSNNNTLNEQI